MYFCTHHGSGFENLGRSPQWNNAAPVLWVLQSSAGAVAIRTVVRHVVENHGGCAKAGAEVEAMSDAELEASHARTFVLFKSRVAPHSFETLRAEVAATTTPYEEEMKRHRQFLRDAQKRKGGRK